ncbi:MAG TPA: hypothetical protein DHW82_02150 [Spirochaetia bacterium]|nr:MAG: hypothetical protein A2Y41_07110 [Spirochaetes bacterium GWB1_36_13]HCL55797.1 hypothetical protein [Spirochaetia bacterium]
MKRKTLVLSFVFLFGIVNFAEENYQWPIKDMKDSDITSFFGESRDDHFHNGIDIAKKEALVYPVLNGEIIFYYHPENEIIPQEWGMGKTIVVQHSKVRSYYMHLKQFENKGTLVTREISIGTVGDSGRSSGAHLHFSIRKDGKLVNPVDFLPVIKNNNNPVAETLVFKSGYYQKRLNNLENFDVVQLPLRENFEILLNTYDPIEGRNLTRAVRKVQVQIYDDHEVVFSKELSFDFIENGKLNGKQYFLEVYDKFWNEVLMILGKWEKKERKSAYTINVKITDNSGNTTAFKKKIVFK